MRELKGQTVNEIIFDELMKTSKNLTPIPTGSLLQYQKDLIDIATRRNNSTIICAPRRAGKTQLIQQIGKWYIGLAERSAAWKERVDHYNAPVKVEFT